MKNWKRLSLVAIAVFACNAASAGCGDCNSSCNDCSNDCSADCCGIDLNAKCRGGDVTSKSIYSDIGFGATGTYLYESLFRNDRMNAADSCWGGAFQAVIFGGKSTSKSKEEMGRRFGIGHKRCMKVVEGEDQDGLLANNVERDIDPRNFNLVTTGRDFASTICLCPEQKNIGVLLNYRQALCRNDDDTMRWYAEVNLPIVRAEHNMNFKESDITGTNNTAVDATGLDDAPRVASMAEAFNQDAMLYGKIDNKCRDKTQLANAEFKIGYNSVLTDCCHLDSYLGVAFKNSADRCAKYLFEPIVGQEHYAFMWGSALGFNLYNWEESSLGARIALDGRYWFKGEEKRSFDLKGKQWGRYIEMYENVDAAQAARTGANANSGSFGVNLLTKCVDVTPGYQLNYNFAFVYEGCNFLAEIGHTLYARQHEKICPKWTEGPVIKDYNGLGRLNLARTIGKDFSSANLPAASEAEVQASYEGAVIKKCDIDWSSGAHEAVIGHTLYGSLGYEYDCCYPMLFSIGGGYDFAEGNSLIHRWTLFGKIGVSF